METIQDHKNESDVKQYLIEQAESAFSLLCLSYQQLREIPKRNLLPHEVLIKKLYVRSFFTDLQNLADVFFKHQVYEFGKGFGKEASLEDFKQEEAKMTAPSIKESVLWSGTDKERRKAIYQQYKRQFSRYFTLEVDQENLEDQRTDYMNAYIQLVNLHAGWEYIDNAPSKQEIRNLRNALVHRDADVEYFDTTILPKYIEFYDSAFAAFFVPYISILDSLPPEITQWHSIKERKT